MNILEAVYTVYPKARDCVDGHIGEIIETIEEELADDRCYDIKIKRCSHCNMSLGDEYA